MPYLTKEAKALMDSGAKPTTVGELTYALQQDLKEFLDSVGVDYQTLAECLGALEGCKADFIERMLIPYERVKKTINGDCWNIKEERPA